MFCSVLWQYFVKSSCDVQAIYGNCFYQNIASEQMIILSLVTILKYVFHIRFPEKKPSFYIIFVAVTMGYFQYEQELKTAQGLDLPPDDDDDDL